MRLPRWMLGFLLALLLLALVAGQSWATYCLFTSRFPGGNDFYARWVNGCALIWTRENPYSAEVTLRTRKPIVVESFTDVPELGRLVLVRGRDIVGGGIVPPPAEAGGKNNKQAG